jgi:hypothetical protein
LRRTPEGELWRATLSQIPTVFGRLAYLASLRDPVTGRYALSRLAATDPEDVDRGLCQGHYQVFFQWLTSNLADQKADLDEYLGAAGEPRSASYYHDLIPRTARTVERQLYLTDLETLLELRKLEHSACAALET